MVSHSHKVGSNNRRKPLATVTITFYKATRATKCKSRFYQVRHDLVTLMRMRNSMGPLSVPHIQEILDPSTELSPSLLSVRRLCDAMATKTGAYGGHFLSYLAGHIKSRKLWQLMRCQCMCRTKWRDGLREKSNKVVEKPHCGCCRRHDTHANKLCPSLVAVVDNT